MEPVEKKKNPGGRPTHEGWQLYHFEKVEGDKGKSVAKCMKCHNIIKNTTITRLLAHRKKCGTVVPFTVCSTTLQAITTPRLPQLHPAPVATPSTTISQSTPKVDQNIISKFEADDYRTDPIQVDNQTEIIWQEHDENYDETGNQSSMDIINEDIQRHRKSNDLIMRKKTDMKAIDVALSSFLIEGNLTFDVVDSKHFKNFVTALNPDYKLPTSSQLKAKVLCQLRGGFDENEKLRGRKRTYYDSDSE